MNDYTELAEKAHKPLQMFYGSTHREPKKVCLFVKKRAKNNLLNLIPLLLHVQFAMTTDFSSVFVYIVLTNPKKVLIGMLNIVPLYTVTMARYKIL